MSSTQSSGPTLEPTQLSDIADDDMLQQASSQVSANAEGEAVILHLDSSEYFAADSIGSAIWEKLVNPISFAELIAALTQEFSVEEAICRADTLSFLSVLQENQLLQIEQKA